MARNGEDGFTLIELLVVVVIVAILAAIAVPTFLNQRAKGQDADAKANAAIAVRALEIYHQEHDGFTGADANALAAIEPTLSHARNLVVTGTDDAYTMTIDSASGDGPFRIEHTGGTTTRTCDHPGDGGCPAGGHW
jgi:type IV pilus assembly protein PilA